MEAITVKTYQSNIDGYIDKLVAKGYDIDDSTQEAKKVLSTKV